MSILGYLAAKFALLGVILLTWIIIEAKTGKKAPINKWAFIIGWLAVEPIVITMMLLT
jgi:hypothetical protein